MSFLPSEIVEKIQEVKESNISEYRDFILDKNTNKLIAIGNQKESLREWIESALLIPRYQYSVCPYNYGHELGELMDASLAKEEKKDLIELYITDALKINEYIDEVIVRNIEINGEKIKADVLVKDIFGEEIDYEYNS